MSLITKDSSSPQYGHIPRILLLGDTGAGKSSIGNALLGQPIFNVSDDPASCTLEFSEVVRGFWLGKQDGHEFEIIDTPELDDGEETRNAVMTLRRENSVNMFLIVKRGNALRITRAYIDMLKLFEMFWGDYFWTNAVFAFSGGLRSKDKKASDKWLGEISKRFPNSKMANHMFVNTEDRNEEFFTSVDSLWQLCSKLPIYVLENSKLEKATSEGALQHQNEPMGIMKNQRKSAELTQTKNTTKRKKDFEQKVKEEELDIKELTLGKKNSFNLIENEQNQKTADDPVDEVNQNERETTEHSDREQLWNQIHELKKENKMLKASMSTHSKMHFYMEEIFSGNGIVDVQCRMSEPCVLLVARCPRIVANDKDFTLYPSFIALHLAHKKAWFSMQIDGIAVDLEGMTNVVNFSSNMGLEADTITTYWLSYDRDDMILKYGKGYAMEETTILSCNFLEGVKTAAALNERRRKWSVFFDIFDQNSRIILYRTPTDIKKQEEKTVKNGEVVSLIHMEPVLKLRKRPLKINLPPLVKDVSKASLNNIDSCKYTFSSHLPPACKVLYETISGPLAMDMEFDFGFSDIRLSDAIRRSVETEGAKLNKMLKTKEYLRITLGPEMGDSPGIPYVLEIWPPKAKSPIHNHADACGLVQILFGTIQVGIFNKVPSTVLDDKNEFRPTELITLNAIKDDVLWMSPEWYQTHQLRNVSKDFCATLNCYRYEETDKIRWNKFDWAKEERGEVGNFRPNTDLTYKEMRKIVLEEWV